LSRKDIEEGNFDAYLASPSSESESESNGGQVNDAMGGNTEKRSKLRDLLLGDKSSRRGKDIDDDSEVDMKITFRSGLTEEKGKRKKESQEEEEEEDSFTIDVKDDRFKALHEEHRFAIDPSNPR
jgi:hypothetical protein